MFVKRGVMRRFVKSRVWLAAALIAGVLGSSGVAGAASHYVIANNDQAGFIVANVSFYNVSPTGQLTLKQSVSTFGNGISGGYFGTSRIAVLDSGKQQCVYASDASGTIVEIVASSLAVAGNAQGSQMDTGTSNGIGLVVNDEYLYASFTDSNTIGTFKVESGCGLTFLNDTPVTGLGGGVINGMAMHGNMLIATYTDGTIQSFDLSGGTPLSNGDEQYSTATVKSQGASYPNSVDITSDGRLAIFGDTSTSVTVEVSNISSGKLSKTFVYTSTASINSSNVTLSPDESMLYVANTEGDSVTALFFDKGTGKLSAGCTSGPLRGISSNFSYLASMVLMGQTGNGSGVYVAEYGSPSWIGIVRLSSSGQKCSLQEDPSSPVEDANSPGLLSIGSYPPRSF
jgi:6-phosphogluconolactonase (cycloisomerase 2 family)